jgi:hypothetical protein
MGYSRLVPSGTGGFMKRIMLIAFVCAHGGLSTSAAAQPLGAGARVECNWQAKGTFHPARVKSVSGDNVTVTYDDDTGETLKATGCRRFVSSFDPGGRVSCDWQGRGTHFPATVASRSGDKLSVTYDDGVKEDTSTVRCRLVPGESGAGNATPKPPAAAPPKPAPAAPLRPSGFAVGARVECNWEARGNFWPARVASVSGANVGVTYDDGTKETLAATSCRTFVASLDPGGRVSCDWQGRGELFPATVKSRAGAKLNVVYDDGTPEETTTAHCKVPGSGQSAPAPATPATPPAPPAPPTPPTTTTPPATLNPAPTGTAKPVSTLFTEARGRLAAREGSELFHDAKLVGTWARLEVAKQGRNVIGVHVFTATFAADGSGTLVQDLVALDARDQLAVAADRSVTLAFRWGVAVINKGGKSATALHIDLGSSALALAYVRQGSSLGTVPVDLASGRVLGAFQLFSPLDGFQRMFAEGSERLRVSLVGARDLQQQLELNSLMQRTMRLGNDNLLMMRTMNAGFRGSFVF